MIVTLDGQRVAQSFAPNTTLQALIEELKASALLKDRLIISVALDGRRLGDQELNAELERPVSDDRQVDLESGARTTVVQQALRGLAATFGEHRARLAPIADALLAGESSEAMKDVAAFIGLWQTCYRAIAQCSALLQEDLTERVSDGRSLKEHLADLIEKLNELRGALEARDMVLLADLLRYELEPLAGTWEALTGDLARQLDRPS